MHILVRKYGVLALFFALAACRSTPSLITFAVEGGTQYFFPMMAWNGDGDIDAVVDITCRNIAGSPPTCNISFMYPKKGKSGTPALPGSVYFTADGVTYPLSEIKILLSDPAKKQTRITSVMEGSFASFIRSETIVLKAVIGGTEYAYVPGKDFIKYRNAFLEAAVNLVPE
ncbi:MAG: hypothetical protein LBJ24_08735 [Treponema sp.]|jgi:hypothetical protein|nr:hypothetical protein [Treponema sp.]